MAFHNRRLYFSFVSILVACFLLTGMALTLVFGADAPKGLVATLKGHTESIYSVAFSPDGKYFVTGSFDKTIKIWDATTWKEIKTLAGQQGHQNLVLSVAVSPDGKWLASGSSDNTAKIWDFPSNTPIREFGLGDAALGLALSPDGKLLAGAGKDGLVYGWNTADGKELFKLAGHVGSVNSVALSANNQWLASVGSDKILRLWSPADGKPLTSWGASAASLNVIAFNSNNSAVYTTGDDGLVKAWQMPPKATRSLPAHTDVINAMALSGDGNIVVTGSSDRTVRQANFDRGDNAKSYTGPTTPVTSVGVTSNGSLIAGGSQDGKLFLWNSADGKLLSQNKAHGGAIASLAVNAQNSQLATAGADGLVKIWAIPPVATRLLAHPDAVQTAVVRADGKRILTGCNDKILRSWNVDNLQVERQFPGHTGPITAIIVNGDGSVLGSGSTDATIRFWNPTNGQQSALLGGHTAPITSLSLSPNGQQVASASEDGTVKLWSVPTTRPKLFAHPDQVTCAVLSSNGAKLLTGCSDKQVRLWDLAGNKVEHTLGGATLAISSVALSSDGASVCGASLDKSITVWNAGDGKEIKKLPNLSAAVKSVAFSPDGKSLLAGLTDGSVKFFDIAMGKETRSIPAHQGAVNAVAYLPKGDQVISGGEDKTIQLWNVADGSSKGKLDQGSPVRALRLSKDGAKAAAGGEDKNVKLWTLADGKSTMFATPSEIRSLNFSDDGSKLLVSGGDDRATIYSLEGKQLESFIHDGPVTAAAFHPDNRQIVTASADKTARLWPVSLLWHGVHTGPVRRVLFSPKGDQIYSGSDDKTIKIWNAADGKLIRALPGHEGAVTSLAINGEATKLISAGADKIAKIWNLTPPAQGAKADDKPVATISLAGPAYSATLSANGTRVAVSTTSEKEFPVQVFDVASSKELLAFSEQTGPVRAVGFLPDNRTVVSASDDKNVRLSEIGVQALLEGQTGAINSLAFHSGVNQILTGGADKTVRLCDIGANKVIKTFGPLADAVSAVGFSRDNNSIAAAGGKVVKIWNTADGKETATLTLPAEVLSLSFNGDKTRLAMGTADKQTRVWDLTLGKELLAFFQSGPTKSVVFHPNNLNVVVAAGNGASVEAISLTRVINASDSRLYGLTTTSEGSFVLTCGADKTAKLWNLGNGNADRTFAGAKDVLKAVAVSKNNTLVATGGAESIVRLYNFADAKLLGSYKTPGPIESLIFSPNNQALIAVCSDKSVVVLNVNWNPGQPLPLEFGKVIQTNAHAAGCSGVAIASDGQTYFSSGLDKVVKAWKIASENPAKNFGHPNLVDVVAYNLDGSKLATGCHDGVVRIWDVSKGQVIKEIKAHQVSMPNPQPAAVYSLAWNNDGKQLVSGGYDGSLKIWDAATGTLVREFKAYKEKEFEKGHREGVFSVIFSPDCKFLASCSSDHCIKLWNAGDGSIVREFVDPNLKPGSIPAPAHPGWVYGLRFTPDGKYLLSIGNAPPNKGHLAVWSVADGKLLFSEDQSIGTYYALTLSPDGKMIGIGTGGSGRNIQENNIAYILKIPDVVK